MAWPIAKCRVAIKLGPYKPTCRDGLAWRAALPLGPLCQESFGRQDLRWPFERPKNSSNVLPVGGISENITGLLWKNPKPVWLGFLLGVIMLPSYVGNHCEDPYHLLLDWRMEWHLVVLKSLDPLWQGKSGREPRQKDGCSLSIWAYASINIYIYTYIYMIDGV